MFVHFLGVEDLLSPPVRHGHDPVVDAGVDEAPLELLHRGVVDVPRDDHLARPKRPRPLLVAGPGLPRHRTQRPTRRQRERTLAAPPREHSHLELGLDATQARAYLVGVPYRGTPVGRPAGRLDRLELGGEGHGGGPRGVGAGESAGGGHPEGPSRRISFPSRAVVPLLARRDQSKPPCYVYLVARLPREVPQVGRCGGPTVPSAGVQQHQKRFVLHSELVRDDAVRHRLVVASFVAFDLGPVGRGHETRDRAGIVPELDEVGVESGGAGAGRLEGDREAVDRRRGSGGTCGFCACLSIQLFRRRLSRDANLPRRGIGRRQREGFDARPPVREEEGGSQQEKQRSGPKTTTTMSHRSQKRSEGRLGGPIRSVRGSALPV